MIGIDKIKLYCKNFEKIENYELAINDTTQMWECHHRNENYYTRKELISLGLYYNCPPCELIFLTREEHGKQYHKGRSGREQKERLRNIFTNKKNPHNAEWNKKISESRKGYKMSDEQKRKLSENHKGQKPAHVRPVVNIDTGEYFSSVTEATRKYGKGHIACVCNGLRKKACGFHWRWA